MLGLCKNRIRFPIQIEYPIQIYQQKKMLQLIKNVKNRRSIVECVRLSLVSSFNLLVYIKYLKQMLSSFYYLIIDRCYLNAQTIT